MGSRAADSSRSLSVKLGRTGYMGKRRDFGQAVKDQYGGFGELCGLAFFDRRQGPHREAGQGGRCNNLITIMLNRCRGRIDVDYFRAACVSDG